MRDKDRKIGPSQVRRAEEIGRRKLSLAEEVQSIRPSRLHEMRRVSAERDTNKFRISLPFFFFGFCASKIVRKGKGAWMDARPVLEGASLY